MELTAFKECTQTGSAEGGHRRHLRDHAHHHHHTPKVSHPNSEFVRTTFKTANNEPIAGRSLMEDSAASCEWVTGWADDWRRRMGVGCGLHTVEHTLSLACTQALLGSPTSLLIPLSLSPHAGTCTTGAYGYNARVAQPVNGRLIKNYEA